MCTEDLSKSMKATIHECVGGFVLANVEHPLTTVTLSPHDIYVSCCVNTTHQLCCRDHEVTSATHRLVDLVCVRKKCKKVF